MVHNLHALHFAILAVITVGFCLNVSAVLGGVNVDGWRPIKDPKDPTVIDIGKFAIYEHNKKAKSHLLFLEVVKGETQVVSGLNYKLIIAANDSSVSHQYEAVVWDKPWEKFKSLISFEQLN